LNPILCFMAKATSALRVVECAEPSNAGTVASTSTDDGVKAARKDRA